MDSFRRLIFRASKSPSIALPFGARSAGHYRLKEAGPEPVRIKDFVQVFWGVAGEGVFRYKGRESVLGPEQVFIYLPGDAHDLRPRTAEWEYRWFTLDGNLNLDTVRGFGLERGLRTTGACPDELFLQLEACLRDITPGGERRAAVVVFSLLARACGTRPVIRREDDAVQALMDRIEEGFIDPVFSIAAAARELGQNRTSLSRRFRQRAGRSPQGYINLLRLQKAMSLLKETDLRITEVAYQSGYTDPNYFARMFRRQCGMEPSRFRME